MKRRKVWQPAGVESRRGFVGLFDELAGADFHGGLAVGAGPFTWGLGLGP